MMKSSNLKRAAVAVAALCLSLGAPAAQGKPLRPAYNADPVSPAARDLRFEPRLAESWERVDDFSARLTLREGVKFHGGDPLTAADVCRAFARLRESPDFKGLFGPFSECREEGGRSVALVAKPPFPTDRRFDEGDNASEAIPPPVSNDAAREVALLTGDEGGHFDDKRNRETRKAGFWADDTHWVLKWFFAILLLAVAKLAADG